MNDLSGMQFMNYTVTDEFISVRVKHGTKIKWLCRCSCGNNVWVFADALKRHHTNYCSMCRPSGVRNEKLYHIYHGIKQRCYNTNNPKYNIYGGSGITMCDEWLAGGYSGFRKWAITHGYHDGLSIDRIDSGLGYSPENCQWISLSDNSAKANAGVQKNRTRLHNMFAVEPCGRIIRFDNISKFSREHNLNYSSVSAALHGRISRNYCGYIFHSDKIDLPVD